MQPGPSGPAWLRSALGEAVHMRKLLKIAGAVAVGNLVAFWTCYALLVAFAPMPVSNPWAILLWTFVVLGAPASIILDGVSGSYFVPILVVSSILNSSMWGLCFGFPIYALSKRFHNRAQPEH